jgi:exodeoxyribonuclease VII large subunit
MMYRINQNRDTINWRHEKLISISPLDQSEKLHLKLDRNVNKLRYLKKIYFSTKRNQLQAAAFRLEALNPAAILTRGYSITRTIPDNRIVQDAGTVTIGQPLSIKLAKGSLVCRVEENEFYEKKHDV